MPEHLRAVFELMRINRPVGWLLLIWPTLAALWLSSGKTPPIWMVLVFAVGCFVMRTAGCIANDIVDRNIDPLVERTRHRPLADGRLTAGEALVWLAVLLGVAFALVWTLNSLTRWLAVIGLAIAMVYPLFKRWTHFPQAVLGIAFSWGILMASTAISNAFSIEMWLFFAGSFFWIVAYDTQYAMVDRDDDRQIGVKSTAILFGKHDLVLIGVLQFLALMMWASLPAFGIIGFLFWMGLGAIVVFFTFQHWLMRNRSREGCFAAFKNNVWVGFTLFVVAVLNVAI